MTPDLTALERHFRHIEQTRMADVPILNPALSVKAVGFRYTDAGYLGVLITPWFINLVLLPREGDDWIDLPERSNQTHIFPSGRYEFIVSANTEIGRYQACSLLSPVQEIDSQETAIDVALAALQAVDDPDFQDTASSTQATEVTRRWHGEAPSADDSGNPAPPLEEQLTNTPLSRRDVLRGRFLQPDSGESR